MTFIPDPGAPPRAPRPIVWQRPPWVWLPWAVRRRLIFAHAGLILLLIGRSPRRLARCPKVEPPGYGVRRIDPIVLDKRAVKYRRRVSPEQGARCLKTICQVHGCGWDDELAHTSAYDALQAGRAVYAILAGFAHLSRLSPPELHTWQVDWYREQAEGLAGHFQRESVGYEGTAARCQTVGDTAGAEEAMAAAVERRDKARSVTTDWPIRPYVETATLAYDGETLRAMCREAPQRPCPAGSPCDGLPCARYEDPDPSRWTLDLILRPGPGSLTIGAQEMPREP